MKERGETVNKIIFLKASFVIRPSYMHTSETNFSLRTNGAGHVSETTGKKVVIKTNSGLRTNCAARITLDAQENQNNALSARALFNSRAAIRLSQTPPSAKHAL